MDRTPTNAGIRLWPPDGYFRLKPEVDGRESVPCTCTTDCKNCKGECDCDACALGWLIYQDDHALWDEHGNLLNVVELDRAWRQVADPRQLRLRFHVAGKAHMTMRSEEGDRSSSVPPVFDETRDPIPGPLAWQKRLPDESSE